MSLGFPRLAGNPTAPPFIIKLKDKQQIGVGKIGHRRRHDKRWSCILICATVLFLIGRRPLYIQDEVDLYRLNWATYVCITVVWNERNVIVKSILHVDKATKTGPTSFGKPQISTYQFLSTFFGQFLLFVATLYLLYRWFGSKVYTVVVNMQTKKKYHSSLLTLFFQVQFELGTKLHNCTWAIKNTDIVTYS